MVAVVARKAHNLEVGGSNPSPATNLKKSNNNWLEKSVTLYLY